MWRWRHKREGVLQTGEAKGGGARPRAASDRPRRRARRVPAPTRASPRHVPCTEGYDSERCCCMPLREGLYVSGGVLLLFDVLWAYGAVVRATGNTSVPFWGNAKVPLVRGEAVRARLPPPAPPPFLPPPRPRPPVTHAARVAVGGLGRRRLHLRRPVPPRPRTHRPASRHPSRAPLGARRRLALTRARPPNRGPALPRRARCLHAPRLRPRSFSKRSSLSCSSSSSP